MKKNTSFPFFTNMGGVCAHAHTCIMREKEESYDIFVLELRVIEDRFSCLLSTRVGRKRGHKQKE